MFYSDLNKKEKMELSQSLLIDALSVETGQYPRTENGMATNDTSGNDCLNFFFKVGGIRNLDEASVNELFNKAYTENATIATSILLWARDPRGGAGERKVPRIITKYLYEINTKLFHNRNNFDKFILCGRADDLFDIAANDAIVLSFFVDDIKEIVQNELYGNLLIKWIPRNEKNPFRKALRKALGMNDAEFRKKVLKFNKVVEQKMCKGQWNEIEYSKVPSRASLIYRNAFRRHDEDRYSAFLDRVNSGEEKINTGALFPYDIVVKLRNRSVDNKELQSLQTMWDNLENVIGETESNAIVMADTSGSMTWCDTNPEPIDVSVSLAIYMAERMNGKFKDHFLTFSSNPKFISLSDCKNLKEKVDKTMNAKWGGSTDLEAAFKLLLGTAVRYSISPNDMPSSIIIVSDMEFNQASNITDTAIQMIANNFTQHGYEMPKIIFWNVNSRNTGNIPVKMHESGAYLVSGASPSILKTVFKGDIPTPYDLMVEAVNKEKYVLEL